MRSLLFFIIRFLFLFFLFHTFFEWSLGLSTPGGFYSETLSRYLDVVHGIKRSLIWGVRICLGSMGISTYEVDPYIVRIQGGLGVRIAHGCVGYGVYSCWMAFVIAYKCRWSFALPWLFFGLLALWLVNVIRISLLLYTYNKGESMPLGIDHHTWFNWVAYGLILVMMWAFQRGADRHGSRQEINADNTVS